MILWLLAGLLSAAVVALLALPLLKRGRGADEAHPDLAVYRDQLAELDREVAQGLLPETQAAAARLEIQRRLLAAASEAEKAPPARWSGKAVQLGAVLVLLLPAAAAAIYLDIGSPQLPASPFAARAPVGAQNRELATLVDQLTERMRANPQDPKGWILLGEAEGELGGYADSAQAYGKAIAALQAKSVPVPADLQSRYGESLAAAADGQVTPAAKSAFTAALATDPHDPRAQFYLALADSQAGHLEDALAKWVALEAQAPADAPWRAMVAAAIDSTVRKLGRDPATLPARKPAPAAGPTSEDMAKAKSMTPEQRAAFIDGMVAGLAQRLHDHPSDVDGWLRLADAYEKLGRAEDALQAWHEAAMRAPDRLDTQLAYVGAAASQAERGALPADFELAVMRIRRLAPENPLGLYCAGLIAEAHGDKSGAKGLWQRLLPLIPAGSPERKQLEARIARLGA
jgi:cytochrome c-type biogenesis protein CcmH